MRPLGTGPTGPRTAEGKARSSKNNLGYGLTSREFVVLPGQEALFAEWITGLRDFQRQNAWNAVRYQPVKVSPFAMTSTSSQLKKRTRASSTNRSLGLALRGRTLRSWNIPICSRRNRFSATRAARVWSRVGGR